MLTVHIEKLEEKKTSGGKPYIVVHYTDEKGQPRTKNIFDSLKEKWAYLIEGETVLFEMTKTMKDGQANWNVTDIMTPKKDNPTSTETPQNVKDVAFVDKQVVDIGKAFQSTSNVYASQPGEVPDDVKKWFWNQVRSAGNIESPLVEEAIKRGAKKV